jgi:saccharopine dehydrogenase (NAD+, L-lysine-forming)
MPKIGIRREDKNEWERRVPLTPEHVKTLASQGFEVLVQPSRIRIFTDREYRAAGAMVQEDLSGCDVVFGIKEMPPSIFRPGQAYMFFAHVIKGQKHNMPMLRRLMETGSTLLDYEKVVDDKNRRLIFFGNYAGLAGMLETLYTLGKRLEWEGVRSPLCALKRPLDYASLGEAKAALAVVGKWIEVEGLPESIAPLVVGFAGYGNVSKGAQEVFDILPHEEIAPEKLAGFVKGKSWSRHKVYKVVFYEKDMVVPAKPGVTFELQDYFQHPEKYRGVFDQYLPHLTALVNCIYWDSRYPRLVTKEWLRANWKKGDGLRVIGDVSCDIEGSIESTVRATDPGNPIYTYVVKDGKARDGWEGDGPVIMAVDTLPSELPREASIYFGDQLMPFVADIARGEYKGAFKDIQLPAPVKRSLIVLRGKFTPDFEHVAKFL